MNRQSNDPVVETPRFVTVQNRSGRWSCWPIDREIPQGWVAGEVAGTREQCLQAIETAHFTRHSEDASNPRLRMSLMFFGDAEADSQGEKYRLMFESAQHADQNGFEGIWLPERHFTKFGCLYPNPALLHAALAKETQNLRLRAGSVVLPLNDPLRVAEQWAVVDNLSNGRVELAFASGWHPDDFALMPDAYTDRSERMFEGIETVQQLWRGESIERVNGAGELIQVRTYPSPVQSKLPVWLTAAGNPETFRRAGRMGCDVLTHLFHQDIGQLSEKIGLYRDARSQSGHDPATGRVAVTLHTFVAESIDLVRSQAGPAYCQYLKSNLGLLKQLAFSHGQSMEIDSLPREELDELLSWMFEKFVGGRSLMGTVETCAQTCRELAGIGVNEIACLMDFGPETNEVLANLRYLSQLNPGRLRHSRERVTSDK